MPPEDREPGQAAAPLVPEPPAEGHPGDGAAAPDRALGEPHRTRRLRRLVAGAAPAVGTMASAVEATVGAAVTAAGRRWEERPGARVRRLRRLARAPLPSLYEVHPEARRANPRQLGVRSLPVDEIRGTAVGGPTQRGADFLPLRPFRSVNWAARWQRIRAAVDRLEILPPIDVVRYADGFWVLDGHNRVAAAHYAGQVEIDASVTELVPPGGVPSERPTSLAAALIGGRDVRTAGAGRAGAGRHEDGADQAVRDASTRWPDEGERRDA